MTHHITIRQFPTTAVPSDDDVHAVGSTLAAAFSKEGITRAVTGNDESVLLRRMSSRAYEGIADLEVFAAYSAEDALDGQADTSIGGSEARTGTDTNTPLPGAVLIAAPPGVVWGETPNAENPYSRAQQTLLSNKYPELVAAGNTLKETMHELESRAFGDDGPGRLFYVSYLGTSPSSQKKGLGGALVRFAIKRARDAGTEAALVTHTAENVAYYSKFGFRVVGDTEVRVNGYDAHFWALTTAPPNASDATPPL